MSVKNLGYEQNVLDNIKSGAKYSKVGNKYFVKWPNGALYGENVCGDYKRAIDRIIGKGKAVFESGKLKLQESQS